MLASSFPSSFLDTYRYYYYYKRGSPRKQCTLHYSFSGWQHWLKISMLTLNTCEHDLCLLSTFIFLLVIVDYYKCVWFSVSRKLNTRSKSESNCKIMWIFNQGCQLEKVNEFFFGGGLKKSYCNNNASLVSCSESLRQFPVLENPYQAPSNHLQTTENMPQVVAIQ